MALQTALITGASSGIGYELSKCFAEAGYRLLLIARDEQRLQIVAKELQNRYSVDIRAVALDLSKPDVESSLARVLEGETIDVLINNAGVGMYGAFANSEARATTAMLELNIVSLSKLTRLVLPAMIARKQGLVLNVGSVAGFMPGPFMAAYFASKAYVISLSEALREELAGSGITVSCLCPGATPTKFQTTAGYAHPEAQSRKVLDAAAVAKQGFDGLMNGKAIIIPGWKNKVMVFATRLAPRSLVAKLVRRWNQ